MAEANQVGRQLSLELLKRDQANPQTVKQLRAGSTPSTRSGSASSSRTRSTKSTTTPAVSV